MILRLRLARIFYLNFFMNWLTENCFYKNHLIDNMKIIYGMIRLMLIDVSGINAKNIRIRSKVNFMIIFIFGTI